MIDRRMKPETAIKKIEEWVVEELRKLADTVDPKDTRRIGWWDKLTKYNQGKHSVLIELNHALYNYSDKEK